MGQVLDQAAVGAGGAVSRACLGQLTEAIFRRVAVAPLLEQLVSLVLGGLPGFVRDGVVRAIAVGVCVVRDADKNLAGIDCCIVVIRSGDKVIDIIAVSVSFEVGRIACLAVIGIEPVAAIGRSVVVAGLSRQRGIVIGVGCLARLGDDIPRPQEQAVSFVRSSVAKAAGRGDVQPNTKWGFVSKYCLLYTSLVQ